MSIKISYNTTTVDKAETFELPYGTVTIKLTAQLLANIVNAFKNLENIEKKFKALKDKEPDEITDDDIAVLNIEENTRNCLNAAFGTDICTPAFGDNSLFSKNSDGKRLVTAFADAFFPVLESRLSKLAANKQAKQAKPTVRPEVVGKYLSTPIAGLTQPYGSGIPDISGLTPEQKKALALQLLS